MAEAVLESVDARERGLAMSDWRVTLTEIALPESDVEAVMATLESGWLTMGPRTQDLEAAFAESVGAKHALAVSSGTAALHLACLAAGVGDGDEVIAPALSFVADAHAGRCAGGETVLADCVSPAEPLLDPAEVERRITDRTKAVIAVHMFGYPADTDALRAICDEREHRPDRGLRRGRLGAACSDGTPAGTVGACGCFSFFAKTQLGVGEGGILVTDDDELRRAACGSLRSHAMTSVTWDRHRGHAETYDVTDLGFNYRIDEPRATLALARLGRLDDAARGASGASSAPTASGSQRIDGVEVPFPAEWVERSGHFAFPVLVADLATRDRGPRRRCTPRGVQTTFYPALTELSEYEGAGGEGGCPVAEDFAGPPPGAAAVDHSSTRSRSISWWRSCPQHSGTERPPSDPPLLQ